MPLPQVIQDAMARWIPQIMSSVESVVPRPAAPGAGDYADMLWYHLDSGGKRLRPIVTLLATEVLGGDPALALPFATGVELLHNATLIHDDYQDGDTVRRGHPTIWRRYSWEQSINAGDGLYFSGLELVAQTAVADADLRRLLAMTSKRMLQVIEGQVNEFRLKEDATPSEADYIRVIRGKTAGLFALPLEGAGICAGLPNAKVAELAQVGDTMGLLFQVQDDLLDLIGDKGRDQVATDIAEGKPSLPVVHALGNASADQAAALAAIIKRPREDTTATDIQYALSLLESVGSIEYALDRIRGWRGTLRTGHDGIDALLEDVVSAIVTPIAHRL